MASAPEAPPPDDRTIKGEQRVLRRIPPTEFKSDGRPNSSPNFDLDKNGRGTSVTLWLSNDDLINVLRGHERFGVVSHTVAEWRAHGLTIARKQIDGDPNHCEIWGSRNTSVKRKLAKAAEWIVYPPSHPNADPG